MESSHQLDNLKMLSQSELLFNKFYGRNNLNRKAKNFNRPNLNFDNKLYVNQLRTDQPHRKESLKF